MQEGAGKNFTGSPGSDRYHFCSHSFGQNSATGPHRTAREMLCDQQEEDKVWGKPTSFCCRYVTENDPSPIILFLSRKMLWITSLGLIFKYDYMAQMCLRKLPFVL